MDIGCGNGKYMRLNNNLLHNFIGFDYSLNLLKICRNDNLEVVQSDALKLPIRNKISENTICIAVLHHISTIERRKLLISELIRITEKGGRILISVWSNNIDDNKAIKNAINITSNSDENDYLVPWTLREVKDNQLNQQVKQLMRYVHLFSKQDIIELLDNFNNKIQVESLVLDKCNWFATFKVL